MNRILNWLKSKILRQIIVVFLVGFTVLCIQALNYGNSLPLAQADTVKTPEGIYYKGTPEPDQIRNDRQIEGTERQFQESAKNVRRKLNLDEPVPEATKEFLDDVQTNVERTVEPITGNRRGYYQEKIPKSSIRDNR